MENYYVTGKKAQDREQRETERERARETEGERGREEVKKYLACVLERHRCIYCGSASEGLMISDTVLTRALNTPIKRL